MLYSTSHAGALVPFRLPDKWVWDFWFARQDGQHHIFYLQAPRALGDPGRRHHNATIGHAVSGNFARLACPTRRPPPGCGRLLGRPGHLDGQRNRPRGPLVHALHWCEPR